MRPALTLLLTLLLAGPAAAAGPLPPIDLAGPADGRRTPATASASSRSRASAASTSRRTPPGTPWPPGRRTLASAAQVVQARGPARRRRVRPGRATLGAMLALLRHRCPRCEPEAGIDAAGNVVVAFLAPAASGTASVRAARRPAGGGFLPAATLSAASHPHPRSAAGDERGRRHRRGLGARPGRAGVRSARAARRCRPEATSPIRSSTRRRRTSPSTPPARSASPGAEPRSSRHGSAPPARRRS